VPTGAGAEFFPDNDPGQSKKQNTKPFMGHFSKLQLNVVD